MQHFAAIGFRRSLRVDEKSVLFFHGRLGGKSAQRKFETCDLQLGVRVSEG